METKREENLSNSQVVVAVCNFRTLTDLSVVDGIEEDHRANDGLEVWSDTCAAWLPILVLPSPERARNSADHGLWRLVTATEPFTELANLHLAQWSVSYKEKEETVISMVQLQSSQPKLDVSRYYDIFLCCIIRR